VWATRTHARIQTLRYMCVYARGRSKRLFHQPRVYGLYTQALMCVCVCMLGLTLYNIYIAYAYV